MWDTMAKEVSFIFIALSVLIAQANAIIFVNNKTVSSDILAKIFIEEIQSNRIPLKSSVLINKVYNSEKCVLALKEIVRQLPSLNVLPFIDSWGTFPSGLLYGHTQNFGNFDECTRISVHLSAATGLVNGQYCLATVPLKQNEARDTSGHDSLLSLDKPSQHTVVPKIAICAPDICDPRVLEKIFQSATENILNGALSGIKVNNCITAKKPDFNAVDIFAIVIFSVFGAALLLSTAYDVWTEYIERPAMPLLLAFSILTNGRKLFAINTTKSPNSIDCLTGIRVFSMIWVVFFHNYYVFLIAPVINQVDFSEWSKGASSMHVQEAAIAVDTFLFMSGLLVAWLGFRHKGKLNVLTMYFHRYLRLTPPVAAVVLFYLSLNKYIGNGPLKQTCLRFSDACKTNWWSTLLYVQNYVHPDHTCVGQSWYLAVDTQLYVISPLILIALWKWGRKCIAGMVTLSLLSIGCVIGMHFLDSFKENYTPLVYAPTHARLSAWLVGVGLGYYMHNHKNKAARPSKSVQLLGWTICFAIMLVAVYCPYFMNNSDTPTIVSGMVEALKRPLWAMALAWLVFACHFGFGGVINSFLSHPWWQPLGRLTYSMYLVHTIVQGINFGMIRTDLYFSNYELILILWSILGISVMVAIIWYVAFESPVLVIEKALLGSGSKTEIIRQEDTNVHMSKNESIEPLPKMV